MKFIFTLTFLVAVMFTYSQPTAFSWYNSSNSNQNYTSPAKDQGEQGEQGPCRIFAAVAAVEAMSHIYYNKPFSIGSNGIDLAEREIY